MKNSSKTRLQFYRLALIIAILLLSIGAAVALVATKPKTAVQPPSEPELTVTLLPAAATAIDVSLEGFGIARALRTSLIAPEVGGRVIEMPRAWKAGERVNAGEILFKIDPADYQIALTEMESARNRLRAVLAQVDIQERSDRARLSVLERSRDLAQAEFERIQRLYREDKIGSASTVEGAEQALNQTINSVLLTEQSLALIPERRNELENEFRASEARVERAALQVRRTTVTAPFAGRVVTSHVELGQIAQPGAVLLTLADDSALEIEASLSASDLRQWLPFAENTARERSGFAPLPPLPVQVEWTDGASTQVWEGRLDRVASFDAATRSAMIAVRVEGDGMRAKDGVLPLADGMFCRVVLPGKRLENVVALPRGAVTFDGKAYLSVDGRLKTVSVDVRRSEGPLVYVTGLQEGDLVITTRLVAPLENAKLIVQE